MTLKLGIYDFKREILPPAPTYPTENLLARWTFDVSDLTDSYNNFDLSNAGGTLTYVTGKVGDYAASMTGGAYPNVTDASILDAFKGHQTHTIAFWFKSLNDGIYHIMCCQSLNGGWDSNIYQIVARGDLGSLEISRASSPSYIDLSTNLFNENNWNHYVFTYDSSKNTTLYVDGAYVGYYNSDLAIGTGGDEFGFNDRGINFDQWATCVYDQIYIYNRALTLSEVQELYNSGSGV